ncbi:MAG: hypothetical protein Q3996_00140 [Candidatus Saccharibacteria bacterium]|nr:hypothetical protein [Candidatus Saccharibacteria bacterium]
MVFQSKQFQKIQLATWQMIILFILMSVVTATLLRINNVQMSRRLNSVLEADKSKDLGLVEERLYDLRDFVFAHMNTSTGTIFLEKTYLARVQRLVDDAKKSLSSNPEQNAYKTAAEICDRKFSGYTSAYAQCFLSEVNKSTTTVAQPLEIKNLDPMLFTHSYAAPNWSPDWAGFAVLIWAIMLMNLVIRLISWVVLRIIIAKNS